MRRAAWQRKQLQTQLASWAELRHDTILYGKQSYTTTACEYPAGYVEPVPAFFARLGFLAAEGASRLAAAHVSLPDAVQAGRAQRARDAHVAFFRQFEKVMRYLEHLAKKGARGQTIHAG
jgi:hypothetical protein